MNREDELAKLIAEQAADDTLFQRPEPGTVPAGDLLSVLAAAADGGRPVGARSWLPTGCPIHGNRYSKTWASQPGKIKCGECERERDRLRYQKRRARAEVSGR